MCKRRTVRTRVRINIIGAFFFLYNDRIIVYCAKEIIQRWEDAAPGWSTGGIMNTDLHTHQCCGSSGKRLLQWTWPETIKCSWKVNRKWNKNTNFLGIFYFYILYLADCSPTPLLATLTDSQRGYSPMTPSFSPFQYNCPNNTKHSVLVRI